MSKVKLSDLLEALQDNREGLSNYGFCLACGSKQDGCEPDIQHYQCEDCGKYQVYGAEEILSIGAYVE